VRGTVSLVGREARERVGAVVLVYAA